MMITSLPNTIPSARTAMIPNKTRSTTETKSSKSLRLIASDTVPSSTRSSPHKHNTLSHKKPSHHLHKKPIRNDRITESRHVDKKSTTASSYDDANCKLSELEIVSELSIRCIDEEKASMSLEIERLKEQAAHQEQRRQREEKEWMARCQALEDENQQLKIAQKQTESECLRLMDELLALEDSTDSHKMYRQEIEQLNKELEKQQKQYAALEETYGDKMERHHRDMFELECLIESKVFKESDLEAALEREKLKVQELESKLREEQEKHWIPPKLSIAYCELCDEQGHDVITCKALDQKNDFVSCYCINCDIFNLHPSEECPNQDETF